jgi:hypothetical protein
VHGNGFSHQLFMKRGGYLVEYFWTMTLSAVTALWLY